MKSWIQLPQLIEYETSNALCKHQMGSNSSAADNFSEGQALTGEANNSNKGKQQPGRERGNRRGLGKGRSHRNKPYNSKSGGKCFYCLKRGHNEKECFLKQKAEAFRKNTTDTKTISGNHVESEILGPDTVIHGFAAFSEASSSSWIIDSGASHHLTGNRQGFRGFFVFDMSLLSDFRSRGSVRIWCDLSRSAQVDQSALDLGRPKDGTFKLIHLDRYIKTALFGVGGG